MQVDLEDIVMQYPGTRATDGVSAGFRTDEVHGLIGENGAGKSTLVSILSGTQRPTSGRMVFDGKELVLRSPRDAMVQGIALVSQEGSLVGNLSGAENIMLGEEPKLAGGVIRTRSLEQRSSELLRHWFPANDIDLGTPAGELPMADQKVIEIVRALRGEVRLLVLDEPTATLPSREKERLWSIIRSLPARGVGVVLISHFLSEISALSDRITVLRDGRHVATLTSSEATEDHLIDLMLRRTGGREAIASTDGPGTYGPRVLSVQDWHVGRVVVPHFELHAGEVVGLIGLTGSGHFGFARSLHNPAGLVRGSLSVGGREVKPGGPRGMQRAGIALVPDHRMENALVGEWDLRENLSMVHPEHAARGLGILSVRRERAETTRIFDLLNVKASSDRQRLSSLSGGNKQKISIGKWLYGARDRYRVMVFIEPTEGVDIGAKREIYSEMRRLASSGIGIVIASSDLLEIEQVTDRTVPFVAGRPGPDIARHDYSESAFIAAMSGVAQ
jgi:ABC-type sugar transport system ATPase subunit